MFRSVTIGHVNETAIRLHWSFLALLAILAVTVFLSLGPEAAVQIMALLTFIFACVVLHEFGHITMARKFGIRTPEVLVLPVGGLAKLQRIPEEPRKELAIAIAGPAVNFVLFGLLSLALGRSPEPAAIARMTDPDANLLEQLALFNLVVGLFNLLPAFPMDGGRIFRALLAFFVPHRIATAIAAKVGQALAIGLALIGFFTGAVLLVFIGAFVFLAATQEARIVMLRHAIGGTPIGTVMASDHPRFHPCDRIGMVAETLPHTDAAEFPVLDDDGVLVGIISQKNLLEMLAKSGPAARVSSAMRRDIPILSISKRAREAAMLIEGGAPAVGVIDRNGRHLGLVTLPNLFDKLAIETAMDVRRRLGKSWRKSWGNR
ncbi:CBS domain-containing protein [Erythrobacter insulae]|uniref:Zinc metalloprotease n=1 Tax=Erythrobacter insulae TaxID=2584124 RepID=A0A547PBU7_9SPHN|nr:site-2 protease family protein [Erythrobacter insulae]TRD11612.1 CBS domain-containing protein [Erythrobacter insulae]